MQNRQHPHLTVLLTHRDFSQKMILPGIDLRVKRFDRSAQFGYRSAEIEATGDFRALRQLLECLRCGVEIIDGRGVSVWSGFVWEVQLAGEGTSLDGVANRVQVEYTEVGGQPSDTTAAETDWANDDDSVAEYGLIEEKVRMQQASSAAAIDRRDLELGNRALPFGDVRVSSGSSGQPVATLKCVGWYKSLAFRYWENTRGAAAGLIVHDRETNLNQTEYLIGVARTATTLSFTAANNRLNDSANSLGLSTNNVIVISGSTSNDGIYNVVNMSTGDWVELSPGVVNESAGASITYTVLGTKDAQSFTLDTDDPFKADEIQVHLSTYNSPTDSLKVSLCSDSSGVPGSELASDTLTAAEISATAGWHRFTLSSAVSLSFNTTYWIVIERTGASSISDAYLLTVDADGGYADGEIKCWDNDSSAWVAGSDYYGDHDLLFRVIGTVETTSIIQRVATSAGARLASYGAGFQDDGVRVQYPQIDLPQQANLVSWWKLEETSGTRYDGHSDNDLTDNNTVTSTTGKVDNAAQFTASNTEWLSHDSNSELQTGDIDFTLTGWVYFDSTGTMVLVEKEDAGGAEYRLAKNSAEKLEFTVWVSATPKTATTVSALSLSTWYFVVGWHDATANTVNIQIDNGTAASTATGGSLGAATTAAVQVGRKYDGTFYYNGRIDELSFWKATLTSAEKTALYNSGSGLGYSAAVYAYPDLAQSFQLDAGDVVEYVTLYLKKVGSPTGTLTLRIETDSGGEPSGTLAHPYATATLSESGLDGVDYKSESFTFPDTFSLAGSTTYWLVLTTDSSSSLTNAAVWGTDRSAPNYVNGTLKVKNGGSWYDSTDDACFEIFGVGAGEFISDVIIRDSSGVYTSAQQDGNQRALEVIKDMLEAGSSNNRQMLMEIDSQRRLILYEEPAKPAAGAASYRLRSGADGGPNTGLEIIHVPSGQIVPPQECPAGVWVDLEALLDGGLGARLDVTPIFIQQIGYDAQSGKITSLTPRGRKDLRNIERDRSRQYHNKNQAALVKLISDQTGG